MTFDGLDLDAFNITESSKKTASHKDGLANFKTIEIEVRLMFLSSKTFISQSLPILLRALVTN